MDTTIIAYSKQRDLFKQLETLSNNVANSESTGFKSDLAMSLKNNERVDGKPNPAPITGNAISLEQGVLKETGRALDVAIEGEGFFLVDTPLGERYTRSGAFSINNEGNLVTKDGYEVSGDGGAIAFDNGDTNIRFTERGDIYATSATGEDVLRGTIGVYVFSDKSTLEKAGNSYFKSESAPNVASDQDEFKLAQGMLESSNVNAIEQMSQLIDVTRSVQTVAGIINDQNQLMRNAVNRISGTQ